MTDPQYLSKALRRFFAPSPFHVAPASTRSHAVRNVGCLDCRTAAVGSPPQRAN